MLYYDISYTFQKYRGVMNLLDVENYPYKKDKKRFKEFRNLEGMYFEEVCDIDLREESTFKKFKKYYHIFRDELKIPCEMVAFNTSPVEHVFGYQVEFLGFDIVNTCEGAILETLLEDYDYIHPNTINLLNKYGLCETLETS